MFVLLGHVSDVTFGAEIAKKRTQSTQLVGHKGSCCALSDIPINNGSENMQQIMILCKIIFSCHGWRSASVKNEKTETIIVMLSTEIKILV